MSPHCVLMTRRTTGFFKFLPMRELLYVFVALRAGESTMRRSGQFLMTAETIGRINGSPRGEGQKKKEDEKEYLHGVYSMTGAIDVWLTITNV